MLKVGLIGCGFMGAMHANCYSHIDGVQVVAVADVRHEKAAELAALSGAEIYSDGYDLINNADVDVIDICLPTYLHARYAIAAMDKVKYLFIEKPVALTKEEGSALIAAAESKGVMVQVGLVLHFFTEYAALAEMIKDERYGKVISANFRRLSPIPLWGYENWLLDPKRSGGAGQDLHIHDVDYVLSAFGKPEKIYSIKNTLGTQNDYVNTLMKYNDFAVTVEGTWGLPSSYPFTATFRVVFEKAVIEGAGGKLTKYDNDGACEISLDKFEASADYKGGNISSLGGYYDELVYFTGCAKAGIKIEKAGLSSAVASLDFVLDELDFKG
jgi:predicted dehydrogenase